jgi:hypothetical protein
VLRNPIIVAAACGALGMLSVIQVWRAVQDEPAPSTAAAVHAQDVGDLLQSSEATGDDSSISPAYVSDARTVIGDAPAAESQASAAEVAAALPPMADDSARADASAWVAAGTCSPALVTAEMLRWMFDPRGMDALADGVRPLEVSESGSVMVFGDYTVTLNAASKTIAVDGPTGADILERDITTCIAGSGEAATGPYGNWQWSASDAAWRYVNAAQQEQNDTARTSP